MFNHDLSGFRSRWEFPHRYEMGGLRKLIDDGTDSRITGTFRQRETGDEIEGDMRPWVTGSRQWEEQTHRGACCYSYFEHR